MDICSVRHLQVDCPGTHIEHRDLLCIPGVRNGPGAIPEPRILLGCGIRMHRHIPVHAPLPCEVEIEILDKIHSHVTVRDRPGHIPVVVEREVAAGIFPTAFYTRVEHTVAFGERFVEAAVRNRAAVIVADILIHFISEYPVGNHTPVGGKSLGNACK